MGEPSWGRAAGQRVILGIRPEDIHDPHYAPPGIAPAEVEALVDVTELMLHQSVRVKDLAQDPKWKAITDGETMIVHVVMPKAEESAAAADATAEAAPAATAEPEVIKKGKDEKEEKEKK